jgi:hypothetical protein
VAVLASNPLWTKTLTSVFFNMVRDHISPNLA